MEGSVLNYSRPRPSNASAGPLQGRAQTDNETYPRRENGIRIRARSVPRARASSPPGLPLSPVSPSSHSHGTSTIDNLKWRQRESVLSQQSSLYPPSTVTTTSAFSGPETPPELVHSTDLPLLDVDDVSYRLKLLVKNNYFLPPVHQKPTALQLSATNSNSTLAASAAPAQPKPPTLKSFFRGNKSPKTPLTPQISHSQPNVSPLTLGQPTSTSKPRNTRPQNRVVVIRETLPSLIPEPLPTNPPSEEPVIPHQVEAFVDPTTAVDGVQVVAQPVQRHSEQQQTPHGDWRRDLLQQAVGLSFFTPPARSHSLPIEPAPMPPPLPFGQPISAGVNNIGAPPSQHQIQIAAVRSPKMDGAQNMNTALRPPPRPIRERRTADESPNQSSPHSPHGSSNGGHSPVLQDPSFRDGPSFHENSLPLDQRTEKDMELMSPEPGVEYEHRTRMVIRPSFSQSPRPSFTSPTPQSPPYHSGPYPYSSSPFGQPNSLQPPRHSAATDHTISTSTLHYSEHGHDHEHDRERYSASRPSMTASSVHSAPRPSMSESHVSHYSATFGDRNRESRARSSTSQSASRRSSLAYLQTGSRSRSLSPSGSRIAMAYSPNHDAPPVPPLPVYSGSDTEGRSTRTVVYVHPTGALSNTAVGPSIPAVRTGGSSNGHGSEGSHYLDPKRGITNCPPPASPTSPRFFGITAPAFMSPRSRSLALPATVDVDIIMGETRVDLNGDDTDRKARSDQGHAAKTEAVENWRDALVYQEEIRRFDGMVIQHIESEKDRFKNIATRGKGE